MYICTSAKGKCKLAIIMRMPNINLSGPKRANDVRASAVHNWYAWWSIVHTLTRGSSLSQLMMKSLVSSGISSRGSEAPPLLVCWAAATWACTCRHRATILLPTLAASWPNVVTSGRLETKRTRREKRSTLGPRARRSYLSLFLLVVTYSIPITPSILDRASSNKTEASAPLPRAKSTSKLYRLEFRLAIIDIWLWIFEDPTNVL